jgi:hypothetical protein
MLADLFPREQLARAVSVLNFGFIAGIGLSAILGGTVIGALEHLPPISLPFGGVLKTWQLAFLTGGILAERLAKRGYHDANMRVQLLAICLWIPGAVLMPLMPTAELAVAMSGVNLFFAMMAPGPQNASLQSVTPNRMRGQATALFLFVFNIVGFGLGPTVIALITDYVFHDDSRVGSALALATIILGPRSAWALVRGLKPYGRLIAATASSAAAGTH